MCSSLPMMMRRSAAAAAATSSASPLHPWSHAVNETWEWVSSESGLRSDQTLALNTTNNSRACWRATFIPSNDVISSIITSYYRKTIKKIIYWNYAGTTLPQEDPWFQFLVLIDICNLNHRHKEVNTDSHIVMLRVQRGRPSPPSPCSPAPVT